MITLHSPFDYALVITLTEGTVEEPRDSFEDVLVLLLVNNTVKKRFKKEMQLVEGGLDWKPWEAGEEDDQILCRLDAEDTEGWRGLVKMQVQKILPNEAFDDSEEKKPWIETVLFEVKKSGL
jgi:hypothetical protein